MKVKMINCCSKKKAFNHCIIYTVKYNFLNWGPREHEQKQYIINSTKEIEELINTN